MGTKIIPVRLPDDHWLLQEKNKSLVIRDALELYRQLSGELHQLRKTVQEVKEMIGTGQLIVNQAEPKEQDSSVDPRLMSVLGDFLDI